MSNVTVQSTQARRELLAETARAARQALARPGGIPRLAARELTTPSFGQEEQWFLHALAPSDPTYNRAVPLGLSGPLDRAALARALNALVERQTVLRTRYEVREAGLVARLVPAEPFDLPLVDLQPLPEAERQIEVQRLAAADAREPFDLASGPVFRASLVRLSDNQHALLFNVHHIAFDGWSESVLRRDLAALYLAACQPPAAPAPSALPDLPIQYADYAAWSRGQLQGEGAARHLAYWTRQLAGDLPLTPLPLDRPRTGSVASAGKKQSLRLRPQLGAALRKLSRQEGVTLFMTLLAGFDLLLHLYSGETDIVVGVPVAGRSQVELENLIGMFTNSLALRVDLAGQPSVRQVLQRVRRVALEAFSHQAMPMSRLIEALRPARVPGQHLLFQALFQLRNLPTPPAAMGAVAVRRLGVAGDVAQLDLTFDIADEPAGLLCDIGYKTALFDDDTITAFLADYENVLSAMAANPDQAVNALTVATPRGGPRGRTVAPMLAEHGPAVTTDGPEHALPNVPAVTSLIEEQARLRPGQLAVLADGATLTYAELDQRANRLAHYLRRLGVGPETIVAVCLERTPALIVALLAIHKAGGAYLPLDPAYPPDRLAYMLTDSGAPVLLTAAAQRPHLPPGPTHCVCLDEIGDALLSEPAEAPAVAIEPRSLAYMIYTSGSTGRPKGVLIEHRSLLNFVMMAGENYGLGPRDRVLQFASLSWDSSVEEIFPALAFGASLVLRTPDMLDSVPTFVTRCQAFGITVLNPPTAFWHELVLEMDAAMLESLPALRLISVGGERARPDRVAAWQALVRGRVRLVNAYGPTEATVVATMAELDHFDANAREVPIGRPVANMQAYVLDEHRRPASTGAIGELYLGGLGIARGYHHQPALTEARFVPDPFRGEPGARLYRTGDLASYRPDGQLEFHGRVDRQLKVRGYRIEPEEIEAALRAHPAVREALVIARELAGGSPVLVAYVACAAGSVAGSVAGSAPTAQELRGFLQARLPQYMLPAALVLLPALPLSLNGKIDVAALPLPEPFQSAPEAGYVAPRNPVEQRLVEIWESLLGARHVGVYDDFFSLGGHSLLAIRVFSQIEAAYQRQLPLALLFESPTIAHLAAALSESVQPIRWRTLVPIQPKGRQPPFFCLPSVGGGVMDLAELARLLGEDQPFYGLQPRGLDGVTPPHETIESMAEHFVEVIRSAQPAGPYALGGYCFGGVVAYEVARQLQAHGQEVALLAIFEGYAPPRSQSGVSQWAPRMLYYRLRSLTVWLQDFLGLDQQAMLARLRYSAAQRLRLLRLGMPLDVDDPVPEANGLPDSIRRIMELHARASRQYRPLPYDGRLTLFNVRFQPLSRTPDPQRGWGRLARGGVDVHTIAGAHYNILFPPHVQSLAQVLQKCLAEADRYLRR